MDRVHSYKMRIQVLKTHILVTCYAVLNQKIIPHLHKSANIAFVISGLNFAFIQDSISLSIHQRFLIHLAQNLCVLATQHWTGPKFRKLFSKRQDDQDVIFTIFEWLFTSDSYLVPLSAKSAAVRLMTVRHLPTMLRWPDSFTCKFTCMWIY